MEIGATSIGTLVNVEQRVRKTGKGWCNNRLCEMQPRGKDTIRLCQRNNLTGKEDACAGAWTDLATKSLAKCLCGRRVDTEK